MVMSWFTNYSAECHSICIGQFNVVLFNVVAPGFVHTPDFTLNFALYWLNHGTKNALESIASLLPTKRTAKSDV
jgi:hypothetical protein